MKKLLTFIIISLITIFSIIYFTYGKEFLALLEDNRVYNIENIQITKLNTLEKFRFYNNGIITYNNQKISFLDYNNNVIWQKEDTEFSKQVMVTDNYIFRNKENTIEVLDKNNQKFILAEIEGNIINVSRETNKTYMIIKNNDGMNSLYIMNNNNEIIVDNKVFDDNITGVSISDKSEGYSLITMRFENGTIINTIYFNLLDDVELWNASIKNEVLIKTQVVNNNVIAIGTKNVYYFNTNGKLMWKNGIYNKIHDHEINKENKRIYILFGKDGDTELISYNFEGKVIEVIETPPNMLKLKVYDKNVFVYNDNSIYFMHGNKIDKIYEDLENNIEDFIVEGNDIFILSKEKLVKGEF